MTITLCNRLVAMLAGSLALCAPVSPRTACGMAAGDSGGPWLAGSRPRSGTGDCQHRSLIRRASAKSLPVSPPSECVLSVRVTLFHAMEMSG